MINPQQMNWPDAVRDLIKHENKLISNRIGWMATLEGFLFAGLSFGWLQHGRGWFSLVMILCLTGSIVAIITLWGILLADNTIHKMLTELRDGNHSYKFHIDPPVWGPINCEKISRPWYDRFRIPWMWLPIIIIAAWLFVGVYYYFSPPRLRGAWTEVVQKYMQTVFDHGSDKDKALTRLAGMPGDWDNGKKYFEKSGCTECHLLDKKDDARSVVTLQHYYDRNRIILAILNSEDKRQYHGKFMPNGIVSTMSPEEFLDVVEYLSSPEHEK